jgi:hypothetical protein
MFSSSVRRAALLVPPTPLSTSLKAAIPRAAPQAFPNRSHQRRQSSSKPSNPADGSKGVAKDQGVPATSLAKDETEASADGAQTLSKDNVAAPPALMKEEGDKSRSSKRKAKDVTGRNVVKARDSWLSHLPTVPSTQHIDPMGMCEIFTLYLM